MRLINFVARAQILAHTLRLRTPSGAPRCAPREA